MNPNLLTSSGFHISLSIGQHLWTDLFSEALPVQVQGGKFNVNEQLRPVIALLGDQMGAQVRQLAAKTPPLLAPPVEKLRSRFGERIDQRLKSLRHRAGDMVKIDGNWTLHITREGSRFSYSSQAISVSARIRAVAEGTIDIANGRRKVPFKLERFLRGSFTLANIHYDKHKGGLIGNVRDLHLELGDHPLIKTAEVWIDRLIENKLARFKEVTLMQVGQINQSLEQALGQLRFMASIDDVGVEINHSNLVLQVNFMFKQKQQAVNM
jgi:hypothetical protein